MLIYIYILYKNIEELKIEIVLRIEIETINEKKEKKNS